VRADADRALSRDPADDDTELEPLLDRAEVDRFRERWRELQTAFVDEPRQVVETADGLVAELTRRLVETFAAERAALESRWGAGAEPSTEELRLALRRYRSFFERLLAA
jgi:hypothetical protein